MHHLLKQQLGSIFQDGRSLPAEFEPFFAAVSTAYEMNELDQARLSRTIEGLSDKLDKQEQTQAKLKHLLALLTDTFNSTIDGILVVDNQQNVEACNDTFIEMWEIPEPLARQPDATLMFEHVTAQLLEPEGFLPIVAKLTGSLDKNYDVVELKDGRVYERYSHPRLLGTTLVGRVWTFRDITDRYLAEKELAHLANYDDLTGLPNRTLLRDRLKQATKQAMRSKSPFALLIFDLDNFKNINDTLGHGAGDRILQEVVQRVMCCLRTVDTLARLGGDEYAVILESLSRPDDAAKVAQKLLEIFALPFHIEHQEVFCTVSIGIAIFPDDGCDLEDLIKHADGALYQAKGNGKNSFQFYTPTLNDKALERLMLENKLRRALEKQEFILYYQPKVEITSGDVVGLEALIRWRDQDLGIVSPAKFIPILEDTGMIGPVGLWVLQEACSFNKLLQTQLVGELRMSVNLSPRQFRQGCLASQIESILEATGLEAKFLELEITEGVLADTQLALPLLEKMQMLGVGLSIDDFGTGYSSLSYLQRFPVDTLKIDRSFIRDITCDTDDSAIVNAIIALGKSLRMSIVAEGVEIDAQLEYLRKRGCDEIQGFLFAKPMPGSELVPWLKKHQLRNKMPSTQAASHAVVIE